MTRYLVQRLVMALLILWFVSVVVFVLLRVSPGDPALAQLGQNASDEAIAEIHERLGLNDPLAVQYLEWMGNFLTLDWGLSALSQTGVMGELNDRLPVTFELVTLTLLWTVLIGVPLGVMSAVRRNSLADYAGRFIAVLGLSVPAFWVGTLVLLIPAQQWGYAPPLNTQPSVFSEPWDNLRQMGPPSFVLALTSIATVLRLVRSELLEVLRADFVRTARAKGLAPHAVVLGHALRNSLIPLVTVLGLLTSALLGGSVIIESIFNLRGVGQYLYTAILQKDYVVAQNVVMLTAVIALSMNLIVDVVYSAIDPRIRYG